ncbi:Mut7-C RNAse domain-containing protein [Longimicrobium sp.]|uniref:Mut7-C RNAse domain-containing protein n=1 Tax=Longimicrobium sp. TaxID=2029185 RepID=UPI002E35D724|nr:Mut7-C RNAse domain-containing protein [Longimicrobium sp.]HEX6039054.1 Mut7-C RNAse domain-containing protein [Longimicrobium sp.]
MSDAVPCPGCRRPYDRARFATGRAVRCTRCNHPLQSVTPDEVPGRVPPAVPASDAALHHCASRGRVYREGTHTARMRRELAGVLANDPAEPGTVRGRS